MTRIAICDNRNKDAVINGDEKEVECITIFSSLLFVNSLVVDETLNHCRKDKLIMAKS